MEEGARIRQWAAEVLANALSETIELAECLFDRAEAAEARATTAEQEAREALAGAHAEQEVSRHWKEEAEHQKARVRELEAFKARVMEGGRGRCECCEHSNAVGQGIPHVSKSCRECCNSDGAPNWTPLMGWGDIA